MPLNLIFLWNVNIVVIATMNKAAYQEDYDVNKISLFCHQWEFYPTAPGPLHLKSHLHIYWIATHGHVYICSANLAWIKINEVFGKAWH